MKKQETYDFNADETKQPPAADTTKSGREQAARWQKSLRNAGLAVHRGAEHETLPTSGRREESGPNRGQGEPGRCVHARDNAQHST